MRGRQSWHISRIKRWNIPYVPSQLIKTKSSIRSHTKCQISWKWRGNKSLKIIYQKSVREKALQSSGRAVATQQYKMHLEHLLDFSDAEHLGGFAPRKFNQKGITNVHHAEYHQSCDLSNYLHFVPTHFAKQWTLKQSWCYEVLT